MAFFWYYKIILKCYTDLFVYVTLRSWHIQLTKVLNKDKRKCSVTLECLCKQQIIHKLYIVKYLSTEEMDFVQEHSIPISIPNIFKYNA